MLRRTIATCLFAVMAGLFAVPSPASAASTDPATVLPAGAITDITVVDGQSRVFLAQPATSSVIVTDLDGAIVATVHGIPSATQLTVKPAGTTLYVTAPGGTAITKINTNTLHKKAYALPAGDCLGWSVFTGGALWFTYEPCSGGLAGFGSLDPASGVITTYPVSSPFEDRLVAQPNRPGRVIGFSTGCSGCPVDAWDLTTAPPTRVASDYPDTPLSNCQDGAMINNAKQVVIACGAPYAHQVFNTADASYDTQIPTTAYPDAVAITGDGRYAALGIDGIYDTDVFVQDLSGGLPGTTVTTYDFGYADGLVGGGVAWGVDNRLYAVSESSPASGDDTLHVLSPLS